MTKYSADPYISEPEYLEVKVSIIRVSDKAILLNDGYEDHLST